MTTHPALVNRQCRLAARPLGNPKDSDWLFTSEPVAQPQDGGVLVRTLYLSLDPVMRGWMNRRQELHPAGGHRRGDAGWWHRCGRSLASSSLCGG